MTETGFVRLLEQSRGDAETLVGIMRFSAQAEFLTGEDEANINLEAARMQKMFPDRVTEDRVTGRLSHSIISIEGIEDRHKIKTFVQNMPARDSKALRNYMSEKEPGVDMSCSMSCPSCGSVAKIDLPIGINFFWPRE